MARTSISEWRAGNKEHPVLDDRQWNMSSLLGVVLLVMALLQAIGFSAFKTWLADIGFSGESVWTVVIIVAEVWGALGFFKVRLNPVFRWASNLMALLAVGFWFIENLRLVSAGASADLANSGLFGKYLPQHPGWWTVLEVSVLLFWTVYSLQLAKTSLAIRRG